MQGHFGSCREDWFTSDSRLSIYLLIGKCFETNKNVLTASQFEYEVEAQFPGEDNESLRKDIIAEYEIIKDIKPDDEISIIIGSLNSAQLAVETEDLIIEAYDCLEKGDVEEAISKLKQGSLSLHKQEDDSEVVSLWDDTDDWEAEIINRRDYPEKYAGIPTGFSKFDEKTGGLFPAELTTIFGLSGKGKSTLMKQIGVNVRKKGFNVLHCANEENKFQVRSKYTSVETGIKYNKWKQGKFTESEYEEYKRYKEEQKANNTGKLYVHTFQQQTDATSIERKLVELRAQGIEIHLVIVDYLDLMSSIKRAYNENDEGGRVTGDLKQIAINFNIPVVVCTQAGETASKQELKPKPFLTASDVFGTKRKVHSANCLVGIVNQTATVNAGERGDEQLKHHRLVICVPKNRDGPVFTFRLIMEVETGRIYEDNEDDPIWNGQEKIAANIMQEAQMMEDEDNLEKQRKIAKSVEAEVSSIVEGLDKDENPIIEEPRKPPVSLKGLLKHKKK